MAVGDPTARPGTTEYSISREFSQSGHIDGLPLGTRGGTHGPPCVPRRRRVQAVGPAGPGRGRRLRRRRGQRHAAHVRHHDRRRRSVFRADRRAEGSRGPGQGHERGEGADRRAHDRARRGDRRSARGRLHVEGAAVPAAGCVAARAARQPGSPHDRRPAAAADRERRRPLQREGGQQHAEPRTAVRVPPGVGRRGAGVRREDPDEPGAARLPASGHRRRRARRRSAFYKQARENGGDFDAGIRAGVARILSSPSFLYRIERDPAGVQAGRRAPGQRRRARVAPVVLPLEQHPRPEAAGSGRGRPAPRAGRARRAGAPHDRGRARRCAGQQLHRPVAAAAQPGVEGRAGPADVPGFRRQHPQGVPPRDRAVLRLHHAREPQRAGAAERRLHVRERAAGQALRHPGRLRRALPPGEADRSEPPRPARTGQHPVADLGGDENLAGLPRQVRPDDVPQHAAAAAAAERADARGKRQGRDDRAEDGARAARAAPEEPAVRVLPSHHRSAGLCARELQLGGAVARRPTPTARRSTPPACWRTAPRSMGRSRCATPS